MPSKKTLILPITVLVAICGLLSAAVPALAASNEKVLYSFGKAGTNPLAGLIFDAAGNLYGTTETGGAGTCSLDGCGTVFELIPNAGGGWREKVLHRFDNNHKDGFYPSASLIFDAAGNLYGTTYQGGAYRFGTVFELTPKANGDWTEKILHSFHRYGKNGVYGKDGASPYASLIFDSAGNLYGTTSAGGAFSGNNCPRDGCGTVFELTFKTRGGWTEKILHNFNDNGTDGYIPYAGLVFDTSGNLYGATAAGRAFELSPSTGGNWSEKILSDVPPGPYGNLIFDAAGNLYGASTGGGGDGYVFELTPDGDGTWTLNVLHTFSGNGTDGVHPYGSLIFDAAGNLYGTTEMGGSGACGGGGCGTVFELTPAGGGSWTETILHNFNNNGTDGVYPYAGLIFDAAGKSLYGTTNLGGSSCGSRGCGTVFEIIP
jgi:uncharacterized repeat protein (TIGR03803 family)